jgi:large subunit ribosomal protein L31
MKDKIHPQYFPNAVISCSCGVSFTAGSTVAELHTEICSSCHPFYTGKQKLLDVAGNVDKFKRRTQAAAEIKSVVKVKKERKVRAAK